MGKQIWAGQQRVKNLNATSPFLFYKYYLCSMETNEELSLARQFIENTGTSIFLTGKAGTGKTTFLKEIRRLSSKRMIVLAPTGIAAINAGGVTIHSFFQLPLSPYVPGTSFHSEQQKRYKFSKQKQQIISTLDLLIIDEISMVRSDLLDAIDNVMRRYRIHNLPFGGVQLLMIGDLQQLAPVVKPDDWNMMKEYYSTPYFFSSQALKLTFYITIELKKVYRQQDSYFLEILNKIRNNKIDEKTLKELNSRYIPDFKQPNGEDYIILTTHNTPADHINEEHLKELPHEEFYYNADMEGTFPESSFPAEKKLVLKVGAQVMFIKNDSSGLERYYNGLIAEIKELDNDKICVYTKENNKVFKIDKETWTNSKYTLDAESKEIKEDIEGIFKQYPLRLAWAITIHKSQGLTFNHAIIDASRSFAHGQTYVALSRCKTLEGLVLSAPIKKSAIISDFIIDDFTRSKEDDKPDKNLLKIHEHQYAITLIDELFNLQSIQQAAEQLFRTINDHLFKKYPKYVSLYREMNSSLLSLINIALKFKIQYSKILSSRIELNNARIQDRIHKGAIYFEEQLLPFIDIIKKTEPDIKNKSINTKFENHKQLLLEALALKIRILAYESNEEVLFSPKDYLLHKAQIILSIQGKELS